MNIETHTITTTKHELKVTKSALIEALTSSVHLVGFIPLDADITVRVPGGGDWSNELLDITDDHPIIISWTTTEQT